MRKKYIPLITQTCVRKILLDDVIYIMKKNRKIQVVAEHGSYEFYDKLEHVEEFLDSRFYVCPQNFIVNLDKVDRMEQQKVFLENGDHVILGRDSFIKAKQYYIAYLKKLL